MRFDSDGDDMFDKKEFSRYFKYLLAEVSLIERAFVSVV